MILFFFFFFLEGTPYLKHQAFVGVEDEGSVIRVDPTKSPKLVMMSCSENMGLCVVFITTSFKVFTWKAHNFSCVSLIFYYH